MSLVKTTASTSQTSQNVINTIPTELLLAIFHTAADIHRSELLNVAPPVLTIRAVCHLWRDLTDRDSSLWALIPLNNPQLALTFLAMSWPCRIFVYIRRHSMAFNSAVDARALELVLQEMSRVEVFSVTGPLPDEGVKQTVQNALLTQTAGPALRTLHVTDIDLLGPVLTNAVPPNLRHLRIDIRGCSPTVLTGLVQAPLTSLTLKATIIGSHMLSMMVEALERLAPTLRLAVLELEQASDGLVVDAPYQQARSITLPHLEKATLAMDLRYAAALFRTLVLPTHTDLTIDWAKATGRVQSVEEVTRLFASLGALLKEHLDCLSGYDHGFKALKCTADISDLCHMSGAFVLNRPYLLRAPAPGDDPLARLPKRLILRYRTRMDPSEGAHVVDRAFCALLAALPAVAGVRNLTFESPHVHGAPRLRAIFAAVPTVMSICADRIYAAALFAALAGPTEEEEEQDEERDEEQEEEDEVEEEVAALMPLPELRLLYLHRLILTDFIHRRDPDEPLRVVGEALIACLDARQRRGAELPLVGVVECDVGPDVLDALKARLCPLNALLWDGQHAGRPQNQRRGA